MHISQDQKSGVPWFLNPMRGEALLPVTGSKILHTILKRGEKIQTNLKTCSEQNQFQFKLNTSNLHKWPLFLAFYFFL